MRHAIKLAAAGAATLLAALPAWAANVAEAVTEAAPEAAAAFTPTADMVSKGDTAWMLISAVLVLLMTIPGLALFYGGLVRAKNMLSVLTQVFTICAVVALIWVTYGYSLAFTGGGPFIGGLSKAFLMGVDATTLAATFTNGVYLPEYAFIAFQMTFAMITPALIVGAFAERVKFSALIVFVVAWVTVVYFPIAHMVWYWAGPDFLPAATDDAGLLWAMGALDFAGGTVVHINAGLAGLVGALIIGKRTGYPREPMPPHSLTLAMVGAALLWVGWFGFNAGSNLEANGIAALATINTFVATAAAAIGWLLIEQIAKGKPSLLGGITGAVAGLVAVTPAAGFAAPMGAIVLGFVAAGVCYVFVTAVKSRFGYDDSLDVFGVHFIGGVVGAIGTGVLADPALGGQGFFDYTVAPAVVGAFDMGGQVLTQIKAVATTILWSGVGSAVLYLAIDKTIGLRPSVEDEREGLDLASHGERAYSS
ncbi:MAG: ammonium transporter [Sphingomonadaceae bacterium]|nr:ammonium transporter [Sphingomonadaceae bacterium]